MHLYLIHKNSLKRTNSSTERPGYLGIKFSLRLTKVDQRGDLGFLRVSSRDCLSGWASQKDGCDHDAS